VLTITDRLLEKLADAAYVRAAVARARKLTGGPNACAATLTTVLKDLGLVDAVSTWTSHVIGTEKQLSKLEQRYPMLRVLHPAEMLPGDVCASRDRPDDSNDAPDHVFTLVGAPEGPDRGNPFALVVDNYCRSGRPYWRNLGRSGWYKGAWRGKTPVAYALRFVDQPLCDDAAHLARQRVVDALDEVYRATDGALLPQAVLHHLNLFRWSPELREFKPRSAA